MDKFKAFWERLPDPIRYAVVVAAVVALLLMMGVAG